MPETTVPEVLEREGARFYHRDSRFRRRDQHPTVVKSVEVGGLCRRRGRNRTVRLDYGYAADKRLYVEVALYKPSAHVIWLHVFFDVRRLLEPDAPMQRDFAETAREVGLTPYRLTQIVLAFAPGLN